MAIKSKKVNKELTKTKDIQLGKISVFFKRSILKSILKILLMEHGGFRTFKSVKNINRLFANMDLDKYKDKPELVSYIWCISYVSKQWLDGVVSPEIIAEMAKARPEYDNVKDDIISSCLNDNNIINAPEAKALFDMISEALQFGFVSSIKDEYISLIDDIDMSEPGGFRKLTDRLFQISQSLLDIKHQTSLVQNKVTFNTSDIDSVKEAISMTISSLQGSGNILKTGIKRWNTLLSPGYMNGRLYVYAGTPASFKSGILLKTALDIRKYNPGYKPKTPGMRPCVVYITQENSYIETIERIWNMTFDDAITNYSEEEATEMLCDTLGITRIITDMPNGDQVVQTPKSELASLIDDNDNKKEVPNIEIVIKYFSYREISTDDLYTIISDLRDENMEVVALVHDYLKRIRPSVPTPDNEKLELNHIVNEEKAIAVSEDIPFISAHQLNRSAASIMDNIARQGKGDLSKAVGREHIGSAWEVVEGVDWLGITNITYKPGTNQRYLEMDAIKRRRIDMSDYSMAQFTHLAHPFAPNNGMRLLDDLYLDKVLSLRSLDTNINTNGVSSEKTNAVPRLKTITQEEFEEYDY